MSIKLSQRSSSWFQDLNSYVNGFVNKKSMTKAITIVANRAMQFTPKDRGDLQESQEVTVEVRDREIIGTIRYDAPHAIFVHEIFHPHDSDKNPPEARWKYLEAAFNDVRSQVAEALAEAPTKQKTRARPGKQVILSKGRRT